MDTKKTPRVGVTHMALMARVNRRLAKDHRAIYKSRSQGERSSLGAYYVIDTRRNKVVLTHQDLEPYARKLGLLADWEVLGKEG